MPEKKQSAGLRIVAVTDEIINFLILIVFVVIILFSAYIYTDSGRLEKEADISSFVQYKPTEKEHITFSQLCEKNPDVFGWITLSDTGVDYPLVQGRDNYEYVNKTPEKTFSLSGSIFLDYRNNRELTDKVSIIYGHHMEKDKLFGSFDKYADAAYFEEHKSGSIVFDDKLHSLDIFAYLQADGYDTRVYAPYVINEDFPVWRERIMSMAIQKGEAPSDSANVVLLSTCASMETNQRLILAAVLGEGIPLPDTPSDEQGVLQMWLPVVIAALAVAGIVVGIIVIKKKLRRRFKRLYNR